MIFNPNPDIAFHPFADGGVLHSKDVTVALALGADAVMMGRYFARMDESPTEKVRIGGRVMKPYWGEGSARARAWGAARYDGAGFLEGVEGFVEYAGKLKDNLPELAAKIRTWLETVTRGGSHSTPLEFLRSANRAGTLPEDSSWLVGFRVVQADMPTSDPLPSPEPPRHARLPDSARSRPTARALCECDRR